MTPIQQQLTRLTQWHGGTLGVSACHLPSLRSVEHNPDRSFQLCSTYKIPMAICLLQQAEQGLIDLNEMCTITEYDLRVGMTSTLNQLQYSAPVQFSLLNLLQFMLQESCNSSTDYILKRIGGPSVVMEMLKTNGIDDLHVDTSIFDFLSEWDGVKDQLQDKSYTLEEYQQLADQVPQEKLIQIRSRLLKDPRDCGTPRAMNELLKRLQQRTILSDKYSELLCQIMQGCKTGPQRILGLLPPGTKISHKTGTLGGFVNDVGIIYLPDSTQIILAVYVAGMENAQAKHERLIAEVARTLYDYFLLEK